MIFLYQKSNAHTSKRLNIFIDFFEDDDTAGCLAFRPIRTCRPAVVFRFGFFYIKCIPVKSVLRGHRVRAYHYTAQVISQNYRSVREKKKKKKPSNGVTANRKNDAYREIAFVRLPHARNKAALADATAVRGDARSTIRFRNGDVLLSFRAARSLSGQINADRVPRV